MECIIAAAGSAHAAFIMCGLWPLVQFNRQGGIAGETSFISGLTFPL